MALLADAANASSESGEPDLEALGLCYLGRLALAWGEHEQARHPLDHALGLARQAGPRARILPLVARAQLARAEADPDLARELLEEAAAAAREGGEGAPRVLLAQADLTADEGDRVGARELYLEALALARSEGAEDQAALALEALARLARAEGAPQQAARFQREALHLRHVRRERRGQIGSVQASAQLGAATARVVNAARLVDAADALRDATDYESSFDTVFPPTPDVTPSRGMLAGAGLDFGFAQAAATSPRGPAASKDQRGERGMGKGLESLTDREREIAGLVGDGLTNKQIAARLVITPATVKTHLAHIFAKLEIARRSELTKEVWRRGGTSDAPQTEGSDEGREAE